MSKVTVKQFEEAVRTIEKFTIIIRAKESMLVTAYGYSKAAPGTWTVGELINNRLRGCIGEKSVEVMRGDGQAAPGQTNLKTVRDSYKA